RQRVRHFLNLRRSPCRTYTFHCRRKSKGPSKWLGLLVNVPFWSALVLALNERVRSSTHGGPTNLFNGWIETMWGRTGSLTLLQLGQDYLSLCVLIEE